MTCSDPSYDNIEGEVIIFFRLFQVLSIRFSVFNSEKESIV